MKILLLFLLLLPTAHARIRNENLRPQLEGIDQKILPCNPQICLAFDGHLFYRIPRLGEPGYYHGGFWLNQFMEFNPYEKLSLNLKVVAYNPAASYGVTSQSRLHPFVAASWQDNLQEYFRFDLGVKGLFFDLDRQTLGAGLTLEEKEMAGFLLEVFRGPGRFRYIFNGTGGFDRSGDVHSYQFDLWKDLLGFNSFTHKIGTASFFSVFSRGNAIPAVGHALEFSRRRGRTAWLAALDHRSFPWEWLGVYLKVQSRAYADGYAEGIVGHIEHDYVSIEQEDKAWTNSLNVFAVDDNVRVNAAEAEVNLRLSRRLFVFTQNEVAQFQYKSVPLENFYFFRHGVKVCPRKRLFECGSVFVSNKMINASGPIEQNDVTNKRLFFRKKFLGMEARFIF